MAYEESQDAHARKDNPNLHARLEYPKVLYAVAGGKPRTVKSEAEEKSLLKMGFQATVPEGHLCDSEGNYASPPSKIVVEEVKVSRKQ